MIRAAELLAWLRNDLRREDVSTHLEALLDDPTLNDDLRLLHLAHSLWPDMPPLWRGRPLDVDNISASAQASLAGSEDDSEWLRSLADGRALEFFDRWGYAAISDFAGRWRDARDAYGAAWTTVTQQGAPAEAVPDESRQLAVSARLAFSADFRAELRRDAARLLDPVDWLLRAPWFLRFGSDPGRISDAQLEVLHQLDAVSRIEEVNTHALNELGQFDPERLRRSVFVTDAQRRLLHRLQVAPGADVIVLGPGQRHAPLGSRGAVIEAVSAMWQSARRQWRWLRNAARQLWARATRNTSGPPAAPANAHVEPPPLQLELRMVRVVPMGESALKDVETYVARLSWRAPADSQHRLRITRPGWLRVPKLTTGLLPAEGQIVLALVEPCRVRLVRRLGFLRWQRTAPIGVHFMPKASPIAAGRSMLHASGAGSLASPLIGMSQKPTGTDATLRTGSTRAIAPGAALRAADAMAKYDNEAMRPVDVSRNAVPARSPTALEYRVAQWLGLQVPAGLAGPLRLALWNIGRRLGWRHQQQRRN